MSNHLSSTPRNVEEVPMEETMDPLERSLEEVIQWRKEKQASQWKTNKWKRNQRRRRQKKTQWQKEKQASQWKTNTWKRNQRRRQNLWKRRSRFVRPPSSRHSWGRPSAQCSRFSSVEDAIHQADIASYRRKQAMEWLSYQFAKAAIN